MKIFLLEIFKGFFLFNLHFNIFRKKTLNEIATFLNLLPPCPEEEDEYCEITGNTEIKQQLLELLVSYDPSPVNGILEKFISCCYVVSVLCLYLPINWR